MPLLCLKTTEEPYSWPMPNKHHHEHIILTLHFTLVDWVEEDVMILESITTAKNSADVMTKATSKILFY